MKIKVKGYLKDETLENITSFEASAIKTKNKVSYYIDKEKYTLFLTAPNKLILNRETPTFRSTIYFEQNHTIPSIYTLKEQDINIEINITTNHIEVSDTTIQINYTVVDSDTNYEYKIEMSE